MRALLSAPDNFGTRWTYDHTILVRSERAVSGYTVRDEVTGTTHPAESFEQAREIVQEILNDRPQLDWLRSWKRDGHENKAGSSWRRQSVDGATAVWVTRLLDDWWSIEIDVNRNVEGGMRSYSWRVEGYRSLGVVQAQALAFASYRATECRS